MTGSNAQAVSIKQIKQRAKTMAKELAVPPFWITDWLLFVINKPALYLITNDDYELSDNELHQLNAGIVKMRQGTPLAYLTGQQEFWSLNFKVDAHTLIPRPDTEVLVEQVLAWIAQQNFGNSDKRLLDLGTGSGCIAISLAHELKQTSWEFVAVDNAIEALSVATYNATMNEIDSITFVQSSWYDKLSTDPNYLFDIIVSNPPYIDKKDKHLSNLTAEPISALAASNNGLADIEHIVKHASDYLQNAGLLAIEHGSNQGAAVKQLFLSHHFGSVITIKDYSGNDRVTLGQFINKS